MTFYADSLGFLGSPGKGVDVRTDDPFALNLVHCTSVPPWIDTMEGCLAAHKKFRNQVEQEFCQLQVIVEKSDLEELPSHKIGVVFGMQHTPKDVDVKALRAAGIRIIAPCYEKVNQLGGGWRYPTISLARKGIRFVYDCAEHGMIIDLSHVGDTTAEDILEYAKLKALDVPIIASHGGCFEQYAHDRNLPDHVLSEIAEGGGVVGICTMTFLLHKTDNSAIPFLQHLEHALEVCGEDGVCIGSDASYISRDPAQAEKEFYELRDKLDPDGAYRSRYPDHPPGLNGADRMKTIAKVLDGHPAAQKVLGENLLNFFLKAL
mgnify:CR=1 FL=1